MGQSNGIITAPVSIDDVKTVLGATSYDLGTLCRHAGVNMWARFKPVSRRNLFGIQADYYKADDGNFGITLPASKTKLADLEAVVTGGLNGWGYDKPTGGDNAPFRLLDFDGYDHKAKSPITGANINPTTVYASGGTLAVALSPSQYTGRNIKLEEIADVGDKYLGLYVRNAAKTVARWITCTGTLKSAPTSTATIDMSSLAAGTYYAYPFLADTRMTANQNIANVYWPLPYTSVVGIDVKSSATGVAMTISRLTGDDLSITATLSFRGNKQTTISGTCNWRFRRLSSKWDDALTSYDASGSFAISNLVLSGSGTNYGGSKSFSFRPPTDFVPGEYRLWVNIGNGTYTDNRILLPSEYTGDRLDPITINEEV